jgi:hypothetical protein
MLWQPRFCKSSIIFPKDSPLLFRPTPIWLMGKFWQNTQCKLQWVMKIVPEPLDPEMGGSSPWWTL